MKRELLFSVTLDDCEVQHFRSGGKGGQNQNKRDTGTRIIHHPSGARGESREERSQLQNKKAAWKRMVGTDTFKTWLRKQAAWGGKSPEQMVEASMRKENLLVHTFENGTWKLIG